jgi:GNAT superfamily N-acetyltransferase
MNLKQNEPTAVCYPEVHVQRYEDLLTYTRFAGELTRRELLSKASGRFARGDFLYSITQNGVLASYDWMAIGGRRHKIEIIGMTFESPKGSRITHDAFTDPRFRGKGLAKKILMQMIWDGYKSGATDIYFGLNYYHSNAGWRRWVNNNLGGVPFRAYTYTRFLFFCRKKEYPYESFLKKKAKTIAA